MMGKARVFFLYRIMYDKLVNQYTFRRFFLNIFFANLIGLFFVLLSFLDRSLPFIFPWHSIVCVCACVSDHDMSLDMVCDIRVHQVGNSAVEVRRALSKTALGHVARHDHLGHLQVLVLGELTMTCHWTKRSSSSFVLAVFFFFFFQVS
jgi:hypothetical protein